MLTAKSPDPGRDLMTLLKGLDREEILHVLSQGICHCCQSLLHHRVVSLLNKQLNDSCLLNDIDNSECVNKTPRLHENTSPTQESIRRKRYASIAIDSEMLLNDGDPKEEHIRFSQLGRKEFTQVERIDGRPRNVVQGLELYTSVFNAEEQNTIVQHVYSLQRMGRNGLLRERTYSEPRKWMRGKGRVTIQFGCCYNYAVDKKGNPPGIIRDEEVDPLPPLFKQMIRRMVRWHILPPTCIPDSCIVNIYDEGDCIPPHIDHHDFIRPFCTVSFLTECDIVFGLNLKVLSPGEFAGPVSIPLPVGSVLILSGNGADIAKHCVPAVPARRISITFRKMDESKLPYRFSPDPELMVMKPIIYSPLNKSPMEQNGHHKPRTYPPLANSSFARSKKTNSNTFMIENDEFPPLGSSSKSGNQLRFTRRVKW